MADLQTKTARGKLKARREPYWLQIGKGSYLGYRAGADTWIVRYRDGNGKQHYNSVGQQDEFTVAKACADRWIAQMSGGARRAPNRGTVRDALAGYIRDLRSLGRRASAWEIGQRYRLTVPRRSHFGDSKLQDIRREDIEHWRNGLRKGRAPRSVNRQVRAVIAGLNFAVEEGGHIGNLSAWKLKPLKDDHEENTALFLSSLQRLRLIDHASPELANLLRGYAHTGARPSELAQATVHDFDATGGTVTFRTRKGTRSKLRSRATWLDDEGIAFFKEQAKDKLPLAPLISATDGGHWRDVDWSPAIRNAAEAANKDCKESDLRIPAGVSAYSFRHSRISELLQLVGLDPVTVAAQCGTSVVMIEKYYFKFIGSSMREKLNALRVKKA